VKNAFVIVVFILVVFGVALLINSMGHTAGAPYTGRDDPCMSDPCD
jgi:hypothetical protein